MTKQEEIKDWVAFRFFKYHYLKEYHKKVTRFNWDNDYGWAKRQYEEQADELLEYLDSNDVVIKGTSIGGSYPRLANYYTIEPLIEIQKGPKK